MEAARIERIVKTHRERRGALLAILVDVQEVEGYLSECALRQVARCTGRPLSDVYGVANALERALCIENGETSAAG